MDLQERAIIVAVQLKTATYAKDRLSSLNEALEIVKEDNLIGGTEFIDPLAALLLDTPGTFPPEVPHIFKVLNKIFTEKNGREFSNIFISKIGVDNIIRLLMDPMSDKLDDVRNTISMLIKHNKASITTGILESNKLSLLIEEAFLGREVILEALVEIGKDSAAFRKLLIFNGFVDELMRIGIGKNRALARCGIKSLAQLMNSDIAIVNYFFELRWKEWVEVSMKNHPEYTLKLLYAFASYPRHRIHLTPFADLIFSTRDMAALYLLSYTDVPHEKWLNFLNKSQLSSTPVTCACKLNFILGIYANLAQKIPMQLESISIGTFEYFGLISNYSIIINDTEMDEFLSFLNKVPSMPFSCALLAIKTAVCIGLRNGSDKVFSPGILFTLREHLQNDSLSQDIRILIGFWLFLAYTKLKNTPSLVHSLFNDIDETIVPLAQRLLTSLTHSLYNSRCQEKECNRCYLPQLSIPNILPQSISLLTQTAWLPLTMHSFVLFAFAEFFSCSVPMPTYRQKEEAPPEEKLPEKKTVSEEKAFPEDTHSSVVSIEKEAYSQDIPENESSEIYDL
ncbi:hypothetical protein NERG_00788 [Nematocida ausubeli]|uniref:Uncharacterized protein n=1 Tax=Nematocida ausubeli (strain ATCC PRA-371 / ERTm2) TaxID=1913371 RepID=H8ZB39_NEMA1|nr:hypothetical protein NERG_00788 [Nematocida ausubeli]